MDTNTDNFTKVANRVSVISIIINLLLSAGKFLAGIFAHSSAMISDAVHSASDVFSTVIVIIGIHLSSKKEDKEHPYGHERLESVSAIVLAVVLAVTGLSIGYSGISAIRSGEYENLIIPGKAALIMAVISIVVKEAMFWYTKINAQKISSDSLMADAWHHRSDALSSVGSFIGIFGARLGYSVLDPLASVVICVFILKAAVEIFVESINKMVDHSCSDEMVNSISKEVTEIENVLELDDIKTRTFGSKAYVDIEIAVDPEMKVLQAHQVAQNVHDAVEKNFPQVKHCMVHVNPFLKK